MNRRGFTLAELVIAICIIGILAAIAVPSLRSARERAEAAALLERIHGIRLAASSLSMAELRAIPPSGADGVVPPALGALLNKDFFRGEAGITLRLAQVASPGSATWLQLRGTTPEQRRILAAVHAMTSDAHKYLGPMVIFGLDAESERLLGPGR